MDNISKLTNLKYSDILNKLLIDNKVDRFGNKNETVSSVLERNKENNNLTVPGGYFVKIINTIMPNHI